MAEEKRKLLGSPLSLTDQRLEVLAVPTPADVEAVRLLWQMVLSGWEADLMEADQREIVEVPEVTV